MKHTCLLAAALLLAGTTAARADDEPSLVVLEDGQTIEGVVSFDGDMVVIRIGGPLRGEKAVEVRLAATSVQRIDPRQKSKVTSNAMVELKDGRLLRGTVIEQGAVVRVQGKHGEVAVAKSEVVRVDEAPPPEPRQVFDAELAFAVPVPEGWTLDEGSGLGERLRLAHSSGRAFFSVTVRTLGGGGDAAERVRRALEGDLSQQASLRPRDDRFWIEDTRAAAETEALKLRVSGWAIPKDDLLVWIYGEADAEGAGAEALKELDKLLERGRWLSAGEVDKGIYLDPKLRLLIEAPEGLRLRKLGEGAALLELVGRRAEDKMVLYVDDDPDPRSALLDRYGAEPASLVEATVAGLKVWRAKSEGARGVAYRVGERTVVALARAQDPSLLVRLSSSLVLTDPQGLRDEADFATRLAVRRAPVRVLLAEGKPHDALRVCSTLLKDAPEDPQLLGLRVAIARAREEPLVEHLDAVWSASGATWVGEELARALAARARAAQEDPRDRYTVAADSIERAATVWPSEELLAEAQAFFVAAADAAFKEGERIQAWARLARARALVGPIEALDQKERELRLKSAELYLKDKEPRLARGEARRAYDLGASPQITEDLYARAEALQEQLERAARPLKRSGGFAFGFPPNRTNGTQRRIRPTAFTQQGSRSRFVRPVYVNRNNRRFRSRSSSNRGTGILRPRGGRGTSRRVVYNGRLTFD
ncbi:MAG: hypothetical protein AB7N76_03955 [Planctomycetota bacterium]